ncbi:hypothetical protein ACEQPO_03300 [Bacillus sp. SL00103]
MALFPYRDYLPRTLAIQLDIKPDQIGKRYPVDVGIVSDSKSGLYELTSYIEYVKSAVDFEACTEHMMKWREEMDKEKSVATSPIKPQQVIARLEEAVEDDAILSVDVEM